jgi:hypothetical protein
MGGARTTQLIALDLAFAAAWGLQRLDSGGGFMAASVTLLELMTIAAYTLGGWGRCASRCASTPSARPCTARPNLAAGNEIATVAIRCARPQERSGALERLRAQVEAGLLRTVWVLVKDSDIQSHQWEFGSFP